MDFWEKRYASPHFFVDNEGQKRLILGSDAGALKLFDNITLEQDFNLISGSYNAIFEGFKSTPYMADINGNGIVDLLMGNMAGGLGIYYDQVIAVAENSPQWNLLAYPNPATDIINMATPAVLKGQTWQLVDGIGRVIQSGTIMSEQTQINVKQLENGVYLWSTQNGATARIYVVHH